MLQPFHEIVSHQITDSAETTLCSAGNFLAVRIGRAGPNPAQLQVIGPPDISDIYLPQRWHGGSRLPDGRVRMPPTTVGNCISALSMGFKELGRGNGWINGAGNPALAPEVKAWQRGYTRESTEAGFRSTGTQVVTSTLLGQLIQSVCCCNILCDGCINVLVYHTPAKRC